MTLVLSAVLTMSSLAAADRAELALAPLLNDAEHVFFGTVTLTKSGARATTREVLKGSLAKGATLEGRMQPEPYAQPVAPKGRVLIVVTDGTFVTFPSSSLEAKWAQPTLALLRGEPSLFSAQLKKASRETVRELLQSVLGHEVIPVAAREAVLRDVLTRATPEWEVEFLSLPDALHTPGLVAPFVEYFSRFPRDRFSSAARWEVFRELASPASVPWLLAELELVRVEEDLNVAHYVFDALIASDPAASRCALEHVQAQGGLWLSRSDDGEVARRLASLPPATCAPFTFRRDLPLPRGKEPLPAVRRLGFFSDDDAQATALIESSRKSDDTELAPALLHAAGRIAARGPASQYPAFAAAFAQDFNTRGPPMLHAASASVARLVQRDAAAFEWLLEHPTPLRGPYGKPDDLLDAAVGQLDYSDPAFAERVLRRLVKATRVANVRSLSRAQPEVTKRVLGELARTDAVLALRLSGRAGIDSLPLEDVARLGRDPSGEVRAAAVQTLFAHVVGSEEYSRAVPHFPLVLDALTDADPRVPPLARSLVVQLAVKGQYAQYRSKTPELNGLLPAVLDRAKTARGDSRAQLLEAVRAFPDDLFVGELAAKREALLTK